MPMGKYGIPYMGNKSKIADILMDILPSGKRFIDLFGGGGAISHAAVLKGKWE
jgi:site-specific DNA-adenine methylase